jgi:hypothetical protein
MHKRNKSIFIRLRRDAGNSPFRLVQKPGLSKGFTLFITIPSLKIVDD